ncbi:hypothetical protein AADG42_00605 [Ammonicoccus fulvus]|uniref:Uncharacterized protein n=1 Tax=Ammonicoccus fulvus TaxID=3138240 RepID=A0ABZ3FIQ9_9ACTN
MYDEVSQGPGGVGIGRRQSAARIEFCVSDKGKHIHPPEVTADYADRPNQLPKKAFTTMDPLRLRRTPSG